MSIHDNLQALTEARLAYSKTNGPLYGDTVLFLKQIDLIRDALDKGIFKYEDVRVQMEKILYI